MGTLNLNTNSKGRKSEAFMQLIAAHNAEAADADALGTVVAGAMEVQVVAEDGVTPIL